MRVIAGRYRGLRLGAPRGLRVRPTADPVRERLFAVLGDRVVGCRFLDVCAGTGSVGIEALSRGARSATFLESSTAALRRLRSNLARLRQPPPTRVMAGPAEASMRRLAAQGARFDLIYLDPPYAADPRDELLARVSRTGLLAPRGWVIREGSARDRPPEQIESLLILRSLACGDTRLTLFSEVAP